VFHDGGGVYAGTDHSPTCLVAFESAVRIPNVAATARLSPSAISTAMAGCCRRSRSGFRAVVERSTLQLSHSSCMRRPSIMARSRRSPHRTTGGTGTGRTWTLASAVALPRKPRQLPGATWRSSSTLSSRPLESGERYPGPRTRAPSVRGA